MLLGIALAFLMAPLPVLVSPRFRGIAGGSGFVSRGMAHLALLPVYLAAYGFVAAGLRRVGYDGAWSPMPVGLVNGLLLYLLLFTVFEAVLGKVDRSVSFRILRLVAAAPAQTVALSRVRDAFDEEKLIRRRVELLHAHRYVERHNGSSALTAKGRVAAGVLVALRRLFPY